MVAVRDPLGKTEGKASPRTFTYLTCHQKDLGPPLRALCLAVQPSPSLSGSAGPRPPLGTTQGDLPSFPLPQSPLPPAVCTSRPFTCILARPL